MKKSLLLAVVIVAVAVLSTGCDLFGGKADYSRWASAASGTTHG